MLTLPQVHQVVGSTVVTGHPPTECETGMRAQAGWTEAMVLGVWCHTMPHMIANSSMCSMGATH